MPETIGNHPQSSLTARNNRHHRRRRRIHVIPPSAFASLLLLFWCTMTTLSTTGCSTVNAMTEAVDSAGSTSNAGIRVAFGGASGSSAGSVPVGGDNDTRMNVNGLGGKEFEDEDEDDEDDDEDDDGEEDMYEEYYDYDEEEEEEEIDWMLHAPSTNPNPVPKSTLPPRPERRQTSSFSSSSSSSSSSGNGEKSKPYGGNPTSSSSSSSGKESVIVCGVDGTIYTLDAWTGQMRGSFQSGGPLVKSSTSPTVGAGDDYDDDEDEEEGDWDDEDEEGDQWNDEEEEGDEQPPKETIIPGLDGKLYSLIDSHHIDMLPIDIQSVIDSPVSTCRRRRRQRPPPPVGLFDHNDDPNDEEIEECGLVMGQRSTKTFAIDPSTGTVRWMQSPDNTGGGEGFTSRQTTMNQNYHQKGERYLHGKIKTVLLQREDYMVRHVDMDSGDEFWSVGMGKFSALDFGTDTNHHHDEDYKEDVPARQQTKKDRYPTSIRPRLPSLPLRSSPDITTATTNLLHQFRSARATVSATLQNYYYDNDNNANGIDNKNHQPLLTTEERARAYYNAPPSPYSSSSSTTSSTDPPFFVLPPPFPSIAFAEDGRSLIAMEGRTGELLWRREIESVVASVYGVGRESRWVALDVRDEKDVVYPYGSSGGGGGGGGCGDGDCGGMEDDDVVILEEKEEVEGENDEEEGNKIVNKDSLGLQPYDWKTTGDAILTTLPLTSSQVITGTDPYLTNFQSTLNSPLLGDGVCRIPPCDLPYRLVANAAKIGRHHSTLFVASTLQAPRGKDGRFLALDPPLQQTQQPELNNKAWDTNRQQPVALEGPGSVHDNLIKSILDRKNDIYRMKISQHTQNGLFLTWSMIALLTLCILIGLFLGRVVYYKKKGTLRKSDLKNKAVTAPSHQTPNLENTPVSEAVWMSERDAPVTSVAPVGASRKSPPTRSLSMSALNNMSGEGSQRYSNGNGILVPAPETRSMGKGKGSNATGNGQIKGKPRSGSAESLNHVNLSSEPRSMVKGKESNTTDNGQIKGKPRSGSTEGVSNVEGFPLLQYSRYSLEFKEISRLGKGGFGTVFKCCNTLDRREYAVKKVLIQSLVDSNGRLSKQFSLIINRVLREVKILAVLDHPNIVRYYTAWLEVETKDDETAIDDDCDVSSTNGNGVASAAIGFSSDFLAGSDPSGRRSFSRMNSSRGRRINQKSISRQNNSNDNNTKSSLNRWYLDDKDDDDDDDDDDKINDGKNNDGDESASIGSTNSLGSVNDSWTQDQRSPRSSWRQGSSQDFNQQSSVCSVASSEDLGFNWDRDSAVASSSNLMSLNVTTADDLSTIHDGSASENDSDISSINKRSKLHKDSKWRNTFSPESTITSGEKEKSNNTNALGDVSSEIVRPEQISSKSKKHILYIQMQLSQKTLLDYVDDRKKTGTKSIDIINSLKMFVHIARGLKHVHEKGLIHRDLKPSNCFMDGSEVKIGDFGLSRSDNDNITRDDDNILEQKDDSLGGDGEITSKVGTSSYASPEQINGSNYNSSTDIFSLGIILFELCYPMYTGMERYKVLEGIRRQIFPPAWKATVAENFSSLDETLKRMLSPIPKQRPSAGEVLSHIESLINKYTLSSLDHTTAGEGSIFLRVEADYSEGVLPSTIEVIKEAAPNVTILQYSLIKRQEQGAIMEFALTITCADGGIGNKENGHNLVSNVINGIIDFGKKENEYDKEINPIGAIVDVLSKSTGINNARVVNEQPTLQDVNKKT